MGAKQGEGKYNYKAYGLRINSQIEIDEFITVENIKKNDIDVYFLYGTMPDNIRKLRLEGKSSFYSKDYVWFEIDNVASYYIKDGNKVIVEPVENVNKQYINIYLVCSCLGFIMLQREKVAIHGSAIKINDKAIIITGNRGAGKSTLTTALRLKGYKFMSDDVAAISIDDNVSINPGFPYQKLCQDVMNKMGYDKSKFKGYNCDSNEKYSISAIESFENKDTVLTTIIEIKVDDINEVKLIEITGFEKLNNIIKNIYRGEFSGLMGGRSHKYIKKCAYIAQNINYYQIIRPKGKFTVEEQIAILEEKLLN